MPFLSSMVVMVAVVTLRRTSNAAELIEDLVVGGELRRGRQLIGAADGTLRRLAPSASRSTATQ
jgi:hypothetical protein